MFLFSGLIFDAIDGSVYYAGTRTENFAPRYYDAEGKRRRNVKGRPDRPVGYSRTLVNAAAGDGRGPTPSRSTASAAWRRRRSAP